MMNVVIDAGCVMVCPDEALDAALAREGIAPDSLIKITEGVYATHEALEAAKKPRKVFNFLQALNKCGREARSPPGNPAQKIIS